MTWYDEAIEPEIRDLVRLLRDNGINTECSCGHSMYVQFQVIEFNDTVATVDYLLFNSGYRDYRIEETIERRQGFLTTTATVYFPVGGRYPVQLERQAAMEQASMLRKAGGGTRGHKKTKGTQCGKEN